MDTLWYRQSAACWNEALPLGNGKLGVMMFGGTAVERLALNEDSLWYGGFVNRVNPNAREALPEVRQLLREDRIPEATLLAEEALCGVPQGERHYEPLGDLLLQQLGEETPEGLPTAVLVASPTPEEALTEAPTDAPTEAPTEKLNNFFIILQYMSKSHEQKGPNNETLNFPVDMCNLTF